ncbi:MAG TPA: MmcQ/YjbR family DNA-binding protein [Dehalococcoidia bacterium]|nr:MmcQ/YjbR family DNA-binding protein [Dehalococcoidia bacterium]
MARKTPLARVREICLALPEAHEQVFGGHTTPTFRVRDKIFVMAPENDDGRTAIWCKAPPGAQGVLVGSDPDRFFAPPYVGPKGWIGMRLHGAPDWELVRDLIVDSYRMTAPKRLAKLLDQA